jgi:hypothetical protein
MTGPCLICGTTPRRLHSDHCHKHGQARGPICPRCNARMRQIDSGGKLSVTAKELQGLTEHASRCPNCAAGEPATVISKKDVHLKMSDGLVAAIQTWADRYHVSFTSAIRILLAEALAANSLEETRR